MLRYMEPPPFKKRIALSLKKSNITSQTVGDVVVLYSLQNATRPKQPGPP